MTTQSTPAASPHKISPWFTIVKVVLLAAFVAALLMLGLSMANHRFFRGGRIDQRGVETQ
jgi:hypothetical protein